MDSTNVADLFCCTTKASVTNQVARIFLVNLFAFFSAASVVDLLGELSSEHTLRMEGRRLLMEACG